MILIPDSGSADAACFKKNIARTGTATQIDTYELTVGPILDASRAINGDVSAGSKLSAESKLWLCFELLWLCFVVMFCVVMVMFCGYVLCCCVSNVMDFKKLCKLSAESK